MQSEPVYFDNNATTPLDPRVAEQMIPWLTEQWGNPSSIHFFGQRARGAVDRARQQVADLIGARAEEIVFASSGTEVNNAVLADLAWRAGNSGAAAAESATARPRRVIVAALEHPSIQAGAARLEQTGIEIARVAPGRDGVVGVSQIVEQLDKPTGLVVVQLANNEIGTIQPIAAIAKECRERGVPILCDAVQAIGKIPVDVGELGVDFLTLAAHKFHGPLGAAALWMRSGSDIEPLLVGGSQERRRRASTENVAALVGFGVCCKLAAAELAERAHKLESLRDRFEEGLLEAADRLGGVRIHCRDAQRLPHTSHVAIDGLSGNTLVMRMDLAGFAISTGAACASGVVEPSPLLQAMHYSDDEALASIRVSFGTQNTPEEVDEFIRALERETRALRASASPSSVPA